MSGRKFPTNQSVWANELDSSSIGECESQMDLLSVSSDAPDESSQSDTSNIKGRITKLFESQSFTDVTFFPKNRQSSISAHRAILAIGSPLFSKMLFGDGNKDTAAVKMEVEISNLSFNAFTSIVKYLYTDEVLFESESLVQDILKGAIEFDIPSLVDRCKQHFETLELTNQNVCSKLQLSISNKIGVLKERCLEFIQKYTRPVINSTDFQQCSPTTVRSICNLQSLNIQSETELLSAVMNWLQGQPLHNRKQMIQPLLKSIRFLTFTVDEFSEALKNYPDLLTSDEGLKIMLYLYNPPSPPDFTALPPWCNKNTASRCFFSENRFNSQLGLNVRIPDDFRRNKISFPLKPCHNQRTISQLTSLLQLRCLSGRHQLKAIRLTFQGPVSERSVIGNLSINVHVHPSGFRASEHIQIGNSESVCVTFTKVIKARMGDLVDIEVEADDVKFYKFMEFNESVQMPTNPHFQCCVSCRPREGKMYFISEVEYGPQFRDFRDAARGRSTQRLRK